MRSARARVARPSLAHRRLGRLMGLAALLATASASAPGCGYSSSRLVAEPGVSSVAVLQFDNQSYRRDVEMRLTQILAEEVRARTPWRIETPERADVLLSGTIRSAETRVLAEDKDQNPVAQRYRWIVECKLVERGTGRELRSWVVRRRQEWSEGNFGESLDASATDGVARSIALAIVEGLERPIGDPESSPPSRKLHYKPPSR